MSRAEAPKLSDLMTRYLDSESRDRREGHEEVPVSEVDLHDAAFAPQVEPRVALEAAVAAISGIEPARRTLTPPPGWATLVHGLPAQLAIPFAMGNFPQQLRDLPSLMRPDRRQDRAVAEVSTVDLGNLRRWTEQALAEKATAKALLGLGTLRTAGDLETCERGLSRLRSEADPRWRTAIGNEEATLLWHRGQREEALAAWSRLPATPATDFNRGLALLFLDRPSEAKQYLERAAAGLAEDSPWHHLASLYLALV